MKHELLLLDDKISWKHFENEFTACISKGKAYKQYEFGNKIGLVITYKSLIITSILAFKVNPLDSKTIEPLIHPMKSNIDHTPTELVYDRGGKGQKQIGIKKYLYLISKL